MPIRAERHRVRVPESRVEIGLLDWGGEGPLVFLHHANGFCAGVWEPVAERLRADFRVVAMDARGHGASSSPEGDAAYAWDLLVGDWLAAARWTLAHTGRSRIALAIGHSFGGTLTLAAAARDPRLLERALLVDPVILPPERERAAGTAPPGRGGELSERARRRRHEWESREQARAWFAERELFADWDPRALDAYVAWGLRDRPGGGVELRCRGDVEGAIFANGHTLDVFALAPRVRAPVRILRARRGSFPPAVFDALAARIPHAEVREVDAGHLVPMERPARVAEAARRFVEETEPGG